MDIQKYTLGTWTFGGLMERDPENDGSKEIEAIKMHIDNGVNQIFTAQNYADGFTETLVGQAIKQYPRDSLQINTAIRKEKSAYDDMISGVEESLARLDVNYLDIVVHHAPIPEVPIEESVRALNKIVEKGYAKAFAVSNYNSRSLQKAIDSTDRKIEFNQIYYNLFIREAEEDGVLELAEKNNIMIQAYRPLEFGELPSSTNSFLAELAGKYNATVSQIALAWITSREDFSVVCTTRNQKHLEENLAAIDITLTKDEIERLRESFPKKAQEKSFLR